MMIEFEERRDKDKVLREIPWNFDKCFMLLKESELDNNIGSSTSQRQRFGPKSMTFALWHEMN